MEALTYAINAFDPDEVVVFLDLGSDLLNLIRPSAGNFYFARDDSGKIEIHPDNFSAWHGIGHYAIRGYDGFDLFRAAGSHYLTPRLLRGLVDLASAPPVEAQYRQAEPAKFVIPGFRGFISALGSTSGAQTTVRAMGLSKTLGDSDFLFRREMDGDAQEAIAITEYSPPEKFCPISGLGDVGQNFSGQVYLLKQFDDFAKVKGIGFRVVTIPVFPAQFYARYIGNAWEPELDGYNLFAPERIL